VFTNHVHVGEAPKTVAITSPEASSKEEAVKSSCKAAISVLKSGKSICLVDLNYNHRSHRELYVVEAKETLWFATFMGSKVLSQWEPMVDGIHACEEYCQKLVVEHPEEEQANFLYRMKCSSTCCWVAQSLFG
jgi:hypothetical protein